MAVKQKTKEQIQAEEAAKKAAEKTEQQKKADAERRAKEAAEQKEKDAITEATGGYNTITSAKANVDAVVGALKETSTVEDVKSAQTAIADNLKTAKEGLKVVKAAGRKAKESTALKQAVTESEGLVSQIEQAGKDLKSKLDAAKTAQAELDKKAREEKRRKKKLTAKRKQSVSARSVKRKKNLSRTVSVNRPWAPCAALRGICSTPSPPRWVRPLRSPTCCR